MTICIVAIYMITDTDHIKKWTFRYLVIALFASFLYGNLNIKINH